MDIKDILSELRAERQRLWKQSDKTKSEIEAIQIVIERLSKQKRLEKRQSRKLKIK